MDCSKAYLKRSLVSLSVGTTLLLSSAVSYAAVVVIGNPSLPFNHLSKNTIRHLFLQQPVSIDGGSHLQAYDQPDGSPAYADFYKTILSWDTDQVANYWANNVFTGQSNPPPKVSGDREAIAVVEGTPGAVSYIDSSMLPLAQGNVKILYSNQRVNYRVYHPVKPLAKKHVAAKAPEVKKVAVHHVAPVAKVKQNVSIKKSPIKKTVKSQAHPKQNIAQQEVKAINQSLDSQAKQSVVKPDQISEQSVWSSLGNQFTFQVDANLPVVRGRIAWYLSHKAELQKAISNASSVLFYLSQQARSRKVPQEMVLLPLIDSDYNLSFNENNHAGLWALDAGMASSLGLESNWWYDGRLSVVASTNAVYTDLNTLHKNFNSWLLAIAAFKSGSSEIQSAIQANLQAHKPVDFWSLSLPKDTINYVANVVALAQIIKYPSYYDVTLPRITSTPYFTAIKLNQQMSLSQISRMAGTTASEVKALNPDMLQWATNPNGFFTLILPTNKAQVFEQALVSPLHFKQTAWQYHKVESGESWNKIATLYLTTANELMKINHAQGVLRVGQGILVPVPAMPTRASMSETKLQIKGQSSHTASSQAQPSLKSIINKIYKK